MKNETRRYQPPATTTPPQYEVIMICPICQRRAFDMSTQPQEPLWVGLKCPQCNKIIHMQCAQFLE